MSKIEWTEKTWNPIVGCSITSPGCRDCYAMVMAARIEAMGNAPHYAGTTKKVNGHAVWTGKMAQAPKFTLVEPIARRKPTTYFVNSMSDLFHESVPNDWIDGVFAVMARCPQHKFQVLTKRAERMRDYVCGLPARRASFDCHSGLDWATWPLPNVWLGVSCERQKEADVRIPFLLDTPAAVRFLSCEPLLGPIDLHPKADASYQRLSEWYGPDGFDPTGSQPRRERMTGYFPRVDWVIVGGESGHTARPMHPFWARGLRDQCQVAGVAFFFKQWGEWVSSAEVGFCGHERAPTVTMVPYEMMRLGKKKTGRLLDGRTWDEFPQVKLAIGEAA